MHKTHLLEDLIVAVILMGIIVRLLHPVMHPMDGEALKVGI
jgi:hypothetical protein